MQEFAPRVLVGRKSTRFHGNSEMVREGPPQPTPYPAEKARGGEIILRTRTQRLIFVAGLLGAGILGLILILLGAFGS